MATLEDVIVDEMQKAMIKKQAKVIKEVDSIIDAALAIPAPDAMMDERSKMDYWKRLQIVLINSQYVQERRKNANTNSTDNTTTD
jgi:hypothetical protein